MGVAPIAWRLRGAVPRAAIAGAEGGDSWKHRPLTEREIERIGEVLLFLPTAMPSAQQGSADSSASAQEAAAEASEARRCSSRSARPCSSRQLLAEEPVAVQAVTVARPIRA